MNGTNGFKELIKRNIYMVFDQDRQKNGRKNGGINAKRRKKIKSRTRKGKDRKKNTSGTMTNTK